MLKRHALPSVMQEGNLPACGWTRLIVRGSTIGPVEPLTEVLTKAFKGYPAEISVESHGSDREATLGSLKGAIRHCIEQRCRLLLVMPDTLIANGGISNMRSYARGKPVSVAAPHLRVTAFPQHRKTLKAADLVSHALNSKPHQSVSDSFSDKDNGTRKGGISLTRINDHLTTIIHYLPTVYLAWFEESDAAFFDRAIAFRDWDHEWDAHLDREGRLRVVCDSEFFFAIELTEPGMNLIEITPESRLEEHSELGLLNLKSFVGTLRS